MGKGGGVFSQIVGAALVVAGVLTGGNPYLISAGITIMVGGGLYSAAVQRREMKKALEDAARAAQGLRANTRTSLAVIPLVYGRQRVGGNLVYVVTDGPSNANLHMVHGIAEGEIDAFEQMWFNDQLVWDLAKIGTNSGYLDTPYKNYFTFEWRTGQNSQDYFRGVNSVDGAFVDRYPMTAMSYIKLIYQHGLWQSVPTVNWTIRGMKTYDPASSFLPSSYNPGSRFWNQNAAFHMWDVLTEDRRYGFGLPSSKLVQSTFANVASYAVGSVSYISNTITERVETRNIPSAQFAATFPPTGWSLATIGPTKSQPTPFGTRAPVRPGSCYFDMNWSVADAEGYNVTAQYATAVDSINGAITSVSGALGAGVVVGSLDFNTGSVFLPGREGYASWWYDPDFIHRTTYQYLARSIEIRCGSETLVETGTITTTAYLVSSWGGSAVIDVIGGVATMAFGKMDYPLFPVEIVYTLSNTAMPRFESNFFANEGRPAIDVVRDLGSHVRGFLTFIDGQYKFKVDAVASSIKHFDEKSIVEGSLKVAQAPVMDRPTRIRVRYIDAIENYAVSDAVFDVTSPITGNLIEHTISAYGLTKRDQANRLAATLARQSELGTNLEMRVNAEGSGIEPGDVIDVSHGTTGWDAKLFRVHSVRDHGDESYTFNAVEHDNAAVLDGWTGGSIRPTDSGFIPKRSYLAPNVTSMEVLERPKTLSDGTTMHFMECTVKALSNSAHLKTYKMWYRYTSLSGTVNPEVLFHNSPEPFGSFQAPQFGAYALSAVAYSDYDLPSPKTYYSVFSAVGVPQYDWQKLRILMGPVTLANTGWVFGDTRKWTADGYRFSTFQHFGTGAIVAQFVDGRGIVTAQNSITCPGSGMYGISAGKNNDRPFTAFFTNYGTAELQIRGVCWSGSLTVIGTMTISTSCYRGGAVDASGGASVAAINLVTGGTAVFYPSCGTAGSFNAAYKVVSTNLNVSGEVSVASLGNLMYGPHTPAAGFKYGGYSTNSYVHFMLSFQASSYGPGWSYRNVAYRWTYKYDMSTAYVVAEPFFVDPNVVFASLGHTVFGGEFDGIMVGVNRVRYVSNTQIRGGLQFVLVDITNPQSPRTTTSGSLIRKWDAGVSHDLNNYLISYVGRPSVIEVSGFGNLECNAPVYYEYMQQSYAAEMYRGIIYRVNCYQPSYQTTWI